MAANDLSVTKQACERYIVRNGYDHATIAIVEWAPRQDSHGPIYGGEILVNSSFGSYCNSWGHCGQPFKRFLIGLDFHYFMIKCLGTAYEEFDFDKSVQRIRERLIELRREGRIDRHRAREAWDAVDPDQSEERLVGALMELDLPGLSEPWEYTQKSPTAQCRGFWSDIWPHFCAAISAELPIHGQLLEKP